MRFACLALLGAAFVLSGCATNREAQEMSRILLAQTIRYEELVERKIKVEKAYYKDSLGMLTTTLRARRGDEDFNIVNRASQEFESLVLRDPQDLTGAQLSTAIKQVTDAIVAARTQNAARLAAQSESLLKSLSVLEVQRDSLEKVRKGLETLNNEPASADQLRKWIEYARKVKDEYDETAAGK